MTCWDVLLLLIVLAWWIWTRHVHQLHQTPVTATVQRLFKSPPPDNDLHYYRPVAVPPGTVPSHRLVTTSYGRKSRRESSHLIARSPPFAARVSWKHVAQRMGG